MRPVYYAEGSDFIFASWDGVYDGARISGYTWTSTVTKTMDRILQNKEYREYGQYRVHGFESIAYIIIHSIAYSIEH